MRICKIDGPFGESFEVGCNYPGVMIKWRYVIIQIVNGYE